MLMLIVLQVVPDRITIWVLLILDDAIIHRHYTDQTARQRIGVLGRQERKRRSWIPSLVSVTCAVPLAACRQGKKGLATTRALRGASKEQMMPRATFQQRIALDSFRG